MLSLMFWKIFSSPLCANLAYVQFTDKRVIGEIVCGEVMLAVYVLPQNVHSEGVHHCIVGVDGVCSTVCIKTVDL